MKHLFVKRNSCYLWIIEVATVFLQSQLKRILSPSGDCRRRMIRTGFFLSEGLEVAEEPGIGQTWGYRSLDQVNSLLDHTVNQAGKFVFPQGLFLSFPLSFFSLVAFPFLSFRNNLY
jgi:hypothetical protein